MNQENQEELTVSSNGISSSPSAVAPGPSDRFKRRRKLIRSFEARALKGRTLSQKAADALIAECGSTWFAVAHLVVFSEWIMINLGLVPWLPVFDPFPFGLLTMAVSLEAIFLSIMVLISGNRQSYVATLRDELNMQVNLIAEEEITKTLELVAQVHQHLGLRTSNDGELTKMLKHIDTSYIEHILEKEMARYEHKSFITTIGDKSREGLEKLAEMTKNGKKVV